MKVQLILPPLPVLRQKSILPAMVGSYRLHLLVMILEAILKTLLEGADVA
jgi:hypothetical protein